MRPFVCSPAAYSERVHEQVGSSCRVTTLRNHILMISRTASHHFSCPSFLSSALRHDVGWNTRRVVRIGYWKDKMNTNGFAKNAILAARWHVKTVVQQQSARDVAGTTE